jgi:hypothetical protein
VTTTPQHVSRQALLRRSLVLEYATLVWNVAGIVVLTTVMQVIEAQNGRSWSLAITSITNKQGWKDGPANAVVGCCVCAELTDLRSPCTGSHAKRRNKYSAIGVSARVRAPPPRSHYVARHLGSPDSSQREPVR